MKGYFSRIAKHSGLRFSARDAELTGAQANQHDSPVAPSSAIDHSETVLVPHSNPGLAGDQERQRFTVNQAIIPQRAAPEKPGNVGAQSAIVKEEFSNDVPAQQARQTFAEETERPENRPGVKNENDLTPDKVESGLPVVETSVFVESPKDDATIGNVFESPTTDLRSKASLKLTKPKPSGLQPSEAGKRDFFTKTAEIIGKVEKGGQDPAEIQNIVLSEVQEWISASPANREIPEPKAADQPEPVVISEVVRRREPGVVTIGERSRPEMTERSEFSEQSFELSIGSVSVVIEEAEKSGQPEPQQQRAPDQKSVGDTRRGNSRLSRHYI